MKKLLFIQTAKIVSTALLVMVGIIFVVPHLAFADVVYSNSFGSLNSDGSIVYSSGSADVYFNVFSPDFVNRFGSGSEYPFGGASAYSANTSVSPLQSQGFWNSSVVYPLSGYFCLASSGSYPSPCSPWVYVLVGASSINLNPITQIITVTPVSGSTVATTTTIGATGYIAPQDASSTLQLNFSNLGCSSEQVSIGGANNCVINFDISNLSSGPFSFATTTSFPFPGTWTQVTSIDTTSAGFCFLGICLGQSSSPLTSTTTMFTLGSPNFADLLLTSIASTSIAYQDASTTIASCNPLGGVFNIYTCVQGMLLPDPALLYQQINEATSTILAKVPFGYATRMYFLLTSSATGTLPSLSLTIPGGYPGAGETLDLTPWPYLLGPGSYLAIATSTQSGRTIMQDFMPYWTIFVLVCFGFAVLHLLLDFERHVGNSHHSK
jgi:hypothetical protein